LLTLLLKDYIIQDYIEKYNTWFWLLSYEKTQMKIKIEISKRNFPDKVWCPTTNDNSCSEDDFDDN
jgi:hypothetical protein